MQWIVYGLISLTFLTTAIVSLLIALLVDLTET